MVDQVKDADVAEAPAEQSLRRNLTNRHIQLIAIGGAIGTGLFMGSGKTISLAGPSIIFVYMIIGFMLFFVMRAMGELLLSNLEYKSFSDFASDLLGPWAGYFTGWTYWFCWVVTGMADVVAITAYAQFWFPELSDWVSSLAVVLLLLGLNLATVKMFGEMEFWFAIIKVIAVIAMILFGGWLLFSGTAGPQATVRNLWEQGGFLPHGISGLVMMMAIIMFSFGGLELVGITAAEADNPEQSIPKATNQVIYRILIFYVGSLAVLLSLMPWSRVTADTSPFVFIFHELGDALVANALNIVVLTAALSVYNSCVYCNSRMLFGLAQQGNAPKMLQKVDKRGVPVNTILISSLFTALCVLINYFAPEEAFGLLMALVVSALVINWAMISLAHIKFRRAKQRQGVKTRFPAIFYPVGNWVCLIFMAAVLIIMLMTPGMAISVWLIPVWLVVLGVGYMFKQKSARVAKAH